MDKKGSHVGMILSFTIFVIALIYLYEIMNPFSNVDKEKEKLIEQVRISLESQLKTEVTNIALSIDKPNIQANCVSIPYEGFQIDSGLEKNHIVKNFSGEKLASKIEGDDIKIEKTAKARIIFAEEIKNSEPGEMGSCEGLNQNSDNNFKFAHSKNKVYSEKKIKELIESLEEDDAYYETREKFFLPANSDFNLVFKYDNGDSIGVEKEVRNTNVFVREFPITYINSSADISTGLLSIFVW